MWHLDIPKTRPYDNGKIEVVARNSAGEAICETTLTVKDREDDYRGVLKNSPRRKLTQQFFREDIIIYKIAILMVGYNCNGIGIS